MQATTDFLGINTPEFDVAKKAHKHREKPLFLRLPPAYHDALSSLARKSRRTLTAEAMIALEEYFTKNGVVVPADDGEGDEA